MGIEILSMPQGQADAGLFNLPPTFDTKRYAAEWVIEGQVVFKQQRQVLIGLNATADGWAVWKQDAPAQFKGDDENEAESDADYKARLKKWERENSAPTIVVGSGNKKFVLMCRPRELQDQVNALFGNASKRQIIRELRGDTAGGEPLQDAGILTEKNLSSAEGGASAFEQSDIRLNDVNAPTAAMST